ncbi:MAG TPA: restriction endonuclease [Pseudomonadota bacterium]|nr:restriction endonuclease [Pseudomonadota bacterium]
MDYFVIRQNPEERKTLLGEIMKGRLRQGWSYNPHLSLASGEAGFVAHFGRGESDDREAGNRYRILRPMQYIKPGDVIVVPRQPNDEHFLVLVASNNPNREAQYSYDFIEPAPGTDDYRHVVYVDPARVKILHYDGKGVPTVMKQRLRSIAYSSAVNAVGNRAFAEGIRQCLSLNEEAKQPEPLAAKLTGIRERMYKSWIESVRSLTPSDFEKLVQTFMAAGGYKITRLNSYDGEGKDVDIECERVFDLDDPLGTNHTVRYRIQIKKHKDQTGPKAVRQLLDEKGMNQTQGVQCISMVISTADDFTKDCKDLADHHGVRLMNGMQFARAYFRSVEKDE